MTQNKSKNKCEWSELYTKNKWKNNSKKNDGWPIWVWVWLDREGWGTGQWEFGCRAWGGSPRKVPSAAHWPLPSTAAATDKRTRSLILSESSTQVESESRRTSPAKIIHLFSSLYYPLFNHRLLRFDQRFSFHYFPRNSLIYDSNHLSIQKFHPEIRLIYLFENSTHNILLLKIVSLKN